MTSLDDRSKGADQIAGDIAFRAPGSNGVPEHPTAILKGAVRSLITLPLLNALYHCEEFERLDIPDRILFEPGEYVGLKSADDLVACPGAHAGECLANHSRAMASKCLIAECLSASPHCSAFVGRIDP